MVWMRDYKKKTHTKTHGCTNTHSQSQIDNLNKSMPLNAHTKYMKYPVDIVYTTFKGFHFWE